MRANYDERLRLYHAGYPTVHLRGKIPQCVGWQQRGRNLFDIEQDFDADPFGNNGVITGEALDGTSFLVLDVDSQELYEEVKQRINTDTVIVSTRRGYHLWFRGVMGNRQGIGGLKLDVRGKGGYATSPFSRVSGFTYRWITALREPTKLAEFDPAWFPEVRREPQPRPPPSSLVSHPDMDRVLRYAAKAEPAVSGQNGHAKTFGLACRLLRAFPWLTEEQLYHAMTVYSERCSPPWTPKEILHKVRSAIERTLGR